MKSLSIITLGAFVAMNAGPSIAADFDRYSLSHFNPYDHYGQTRGTTIRAYLRIPFTGGLKRPKEEPRFGLALSRSRPGKYGFTSGFASSDAPKLLDLSIGFSGPDSFRFNGMSIADMRALYAYKTRNGLKTGTVVVLGVGVLAAGAVLMATLIDFDLSKCPDGSERGLLFLCPGDLSG